MKTSWGIPLLILFSMLWLCTGLRAATITSVDNGNAANQRWDQASSWVGGVLPGPGDDVIISGGSTIDLFSAFSFQIQSLTVQTGGTLNQDGALTVTGLVLVETGAAHRQLNQLSITGDLINNGTYTVRGGNGTAGTITSPSTGRIINNGTFNIEPLNPSAVEVELEVPFTNEATGTVNASCRTVSASNQTLINRGIFNHTLNRFLVAVENKSGATFNASSGNLMAQFTNETGAIFNVLSGSKHIFGDPNFPGTVTNAGTIAVASNAILELRGGDYIFTDGTLEGAGLLDFKGECAITAADADGFNLAIDSVILFRQTIRGVSSGGTVPKLTIEPTTTFEVLDIATITGFEVIENRGTFNWFISVTNNFEKAFGQNIVNEATMNISGAEVIDSTTSQDLLLTNEVGATINAGGFAGDFQIDLLNRGTWNQTSGEARVEKVTNEATGSINILSTGSMRWGNLTTSPTLVNAGNVTVDGTWTLLDGSYTLTGGTIGGEGLIRFSQQSLTITATDGFAPAVDSMIMTGPNNQVIMGTAGTCLTIPAGTSFGWDRNGEILGFDLVVNRGLMNLFAPSSLFIKLIGSDLVNEVTGVIKIDITRTRLSDAPSTTNQVINAPGGTLLDQTNASLAITTLGANGIPITDAANVCVLPECGNTNLISSTQSGPWTDPATWAGGVVPNSNQAVSINATHTVTLAAGQSVQIRALQIAANGTFTQAGLLDVECSFVNNGTYEITPGTGTNGTLNGVNLDNQGQLTIAASAVGATAKLNVIITNNGAATLSGDVTSANASAFTNAAGQNVNITGGAFNKAMVNNGTIDATGGSFRNLDNNASLNITALRLGDNGNVGATADLGGAIDVTGALALENGTYEVDGGTISGTGTINVTATGTATINAAPASGFGEFAPGVGTLNITGTGTLTGGPNSCLRIPTGTIANWSDEASITGFQSIFNDGTLNFNDVDGAANHQLGINLFNGTDGIIDFNGLTLDISQVSAGVDAQIFNYNADAADILNNSLPNVIQAIVGTIPACGDPAPVIAGFETVSDGDWTNPAIWATGRVPTSTDDVTIRHAVNTLPGSGNLAAQNLVIESTGPGPSAPSVTVELSGTERLTVNGDLTNGGTLTVVSGELEVTSNATDPGNVTNNGAIEIQDAGEFNVAGNLGNQNTLEVVGAGTLSGSATSTLANNGTLTVTIPLTGGSPSIEGFMQLENLGVVNMTNLSGNIINFIQLEVDVTNGDPTNFPLPNPLPSPLPSVCTGAAFNVVDAVVLALSKDFQNYATVSINSTITGGLLVPGLYFTLSGGLVSSPVPVPPGSPATSPMIGFTNHSPCSIEMSGTGTGFIDVIDNIASGAIRIAPNSRFQTDSLANAGLIEVEGVLDFVGAKLVNKIGGQMRGLGTIAFFDTTTIEGDFAPEVATIDFEGGGIEPASPSATFTIPPTRTLNWKRRTKLGAFNTFRNKGTLNFNTPAAEINTVETNIINAAEATFNVISGDLSSPADTLLNEGTIDFAGTVSVTLDFAINNLAGSKFIQCGPTPPTLPQGVTNDPSVTIGIGPGATRTISDAVIANSIEVQAGGTLNLTGTTDDPDFEGASFTNEGTVNIDPGKSLVLGGTTAQTIGGQNATFPSVKIDNPAGVNIDGIVQVNGNIELVDGILTIVSGSLEVRDIIGATSTKFVVLAPKAFLIKEIDGTPNLFPVGPNPNEYTPITFQRHANATEPTTSFSVGVEVLATSKSANQAEINSAQTAVSTNQSQVNSLTTELATLNSQLTTAQDDLAAEQATNATLQAALDVALASGNQTAIDQAQAALTASDNAIANLEFDIDDLQDQIAAKQQEISDAQAALTEAQAALAKAIASMEELDNKSPLSSGTVNYVWELNRTEGQALVDVTVTFDPTQSDQVFSLPGAYLSRGTARATGKRTFEPLRSSLGTGVLNNGLGSVQAFGVQDFSPFSIGSGPSLATPDTTRENAVTNDPNLVGTDTVRLTNIFGADSLIITTTILENNPTFSPIDAIVCADEASAYDLTQFEAQLTASPGNFRYQIQGGGSGVGPTELLITEYVEGTARNRYIEIFNGTGSTVDLGNYELQIFENGRTSRAKISPLSGSLPTGEVAIFSRSGATAYGGASTSIPSLNNMTGDDAVVLFNTVTGIAVDIIGTVGEDPGRAWTVGGNTTANSTLRRKSEVSTGNTASTPGFPTLGTEWISFPKDDVSGLGTHTINTTGGGGPIADPTRVAVSLNEVYEVSFVAQSGGTDNTTITIAQIVDRDTTIITNKTCDPNLVSTVEELLTNQFGCDSLVITETVLDDPIVCNPSVCICNADAGTLTQLNAFYQRQFHTGSDDTLDLIAKHVVTPTVPSCARVMYILTQNKNFDLVDISDTPDFQVSQRNSAIFYIHTLVADLNPSSPKYLDITSLQFGQDKLADLTALIQNQPDACVDLDEPGIRFIVKPCRTDNGDLNASAIQYQGNIATISATATNVVNSRGFESVYLLTDENEVILATATTPSFMVDPPSSYQIFALSYDPRAGSPDYLDLSRITLGTSTIAELAAIIDDEKLCADLDATGVSFDLSSPFRTGFNQQIDLYPNPTQDKLAIRVERPGAYSYQLVDMYGKVVMRGELTFSSKAQQLNLHSLVKGVYTLKLNQLATGQAYLMQVIKE